MHTGKGEDMKMARASEEDLKAALLLNGILEDVDGGKCPRRVDGEDDENKPEDFDRNNLDHLRMFYDRVMHCARTRPSGIARVIWGFATIVDNNILDPEAKHLELHPRLKAHEEILKALQMALDFWTISSDDYEKKYYPEAGPITLIEKIKAAIENAAQPDTPGKTGTSDKPNTPENTTNASTCPAMICQSKDYPKRWNGRVPTRVRMTMTVRPDPWAAAIMKPEEADSKVCEQGKEYDVWCNSHGAVSAIFPNGSALGLKPNEFEIIAWVRPEGVKRDE